MKRLKLRWSSSWLWALSVAIIHLVSERATTTTVRSVTDYMLASKLAKVRKMADEKR